MKNNETPSAGVQSLKGSWKVLFNAAYKFQIENGADHETAEFLALRSIHKKMHSTKKNLKYFSKSIAYSKFIRTFVLFFSF